MSQTATSSLPPASGPGLRSHGRSLLVLGLPLIGSNLAQNAIQFVDVVMLGWYDVSALAAVSLATPYWFILFLLGAGFAWAVAPMVAEAVEHGDTTAARRVTRMGLWLSVAAALVFVPAFWWSGQVFLWLGQAPELAEAAQSYLRITGWGMLPALLVITLRSFLSALELTRIILWVSIGAALLNALLNWLLIFGNLGFPELGIRGAAIASASLQLASFVGLFFYCRVRVADYDLFSRFWRFDAQIAWRVFRIGLPMGLTTVSEAMLFSVSAIMMGWIGEVWLAAHGIAMQITSLMFMVHLGLSQAGTVRAGRALGRGDGTGLRRGAGAALILSGAMVVLTVGIFLGAPGFLVGLFVDPQDPARDAILAAGMTLLAIGAVFQLVDAAQVMTLGLLRGVQDTAVPLLIACISYWVLGLPAGYVLGFTLGLGGVGVWLGMVIGLGAAAIMLSVRFWRQAARIGA